MDKCHSPIFKDFLVSLLNLKRSMPSEHKLYRENSSLVNIWKLWGGPIKRYLGWRRVKRMNSADSSDEFKEKKKIFFTAKWLFHISQYLCISLCLSIPGSLPIAGLTEEACVPPLIFVWLPRQREEQPKQPRPQLIWSKMPSPLSGQTLGGLAERQDGRVTDHTGGL